MSAPSQNEIVEAFKNLGNTASYHYADDSTKEWNLGHKAEDEALAIFDANPNLETELRSVARGFLWSLTSKRPLLQHQGITS
ncbi:MAG TPA: hypothetical protein VJA26_12765 [Gammaproteobacteria bacterium]|nr:hypothetical protein [Gammaproteobacteria bacterium]